MIALHASRPEGRNDNASYAYIATDECRRWGTKRRHDTATPLHVAGSPVPASKHEPPGIQTWTLPASTSHQLRSLGRSGGICLWSSRATLLASHARPPQPARVDTVVDAGPVSQWSGLKRTVEGLSRGQYVYFVAIGVEGCKRPVGAPSGHGGAAGHLVAVQGEDEEAGGGVELEAHRVAAAVLGRRRQALGAATGEAAAPPAVAVRPAAQRTAHKRGGGLDRRPKGYGPRARTYVCGCGFRRP